MVKVRDADALARFEADPDVEIATSVGTNLNYLILNPNNPPFDDVRVRQAIQHAIDKDLILETVLETERPFPPSGSATRAPRRSGIQVSS